MEMIAKRYFPRAACVPKCFHVKQLATDVLQQISIKVRWEALDIENDAIEQAKFTETEYEVLLNEDTLKQLLARSRYALYKKSSP